MAIIHDILNFATLWLQNCNYGKIPPRETVFASLHHAFCLSISYAQVDEIKSASKTIPKKSGHSKDSDGGDGVGLDVFFFLFDGLGSLRTSKLQNRENYPSAISVDIALQLRIEPASYYVLQPRIRGNWGCSRPTFAHMGYLIEDDVEASNISRTNDWRVLGLNLIKSLLHVPRGTGFMQELLPTTGISVRSSGCAECSCANQSKFWGFEFRFAKTGIPGWIQENSAFSTNTNFSGFCLARLCESGRFIPHYYNSIDVWGVQGGLVFPFWNVLTWGPETVSPIDREEVAAGDGTLQTWSRAFLPGS